VFEKMKIKDEFIEKLATNLPDRPKMVAALNQKIEDCQEFINDIAQHKYTYLCDKCISKLVAFVKRNIDTGSNQREGQI